jgi:hypothetical protein
MKDESSRRRLGKELKQPDFRPSVEAHNEFLVNAVACWRERIKPTPSTRGRRQ